MKRQWRLARTTTAQVNGQQRWDQAYHHLLRWATVNQPSLATEQLPALPMTQEEIHASSCVCPRVDVTPGSVADD